MGEIILMGKSFHKQEKILTKISVFTELINNYKVFIIKISTGFFTKCVKIALKFIPKLKIQEKLL